MMLYFIREHKSGLYWNNMYGWVDAKGADKFTEIEHTDFNLPIGGYWEKCK